VNLLLATGKVDPDSKDHGGWTPLLYCVRHRYDEAVVRLLLATGKVDIKSRNKSGRSPLSYAKSRRNKTMLNLLQFYSDPSSCHSQSSLQISPSTVFSSSNPDQMLLE
jgi:ankyrin repeat protein